MDVLDSNSVVIKEGDKLNLWYAPMSTCKGWVTKEGGVLMFNTKEAYPRSCRLSVAASGGNALTVLGWKV